MCKYNRLYIWVEGRDDQRLFDRVVKPRFERKYGRGQVHIRQYGRMKSATFTAFLKDIKAKNDDYIFVADNDKLRCIPGRKEEIQKERESIDDKDRIMLVIRKIEGWYLAGLSDDTCKKFGLLPFGTTDKIGKGKFKEYWYAKFDSRLDFIQEVLKSFDIETAKQKNTSFRYFFRKFVCEAQ